jgi:hypothetical protein
MSCDAGAPDCGAGAIPPDLPAPCACVTLCLVELELEEAAVAEEEFDWDAASPPVLEFAEPTWVDVAAEPADWFVVADWSAVCD